MECAAYQLGPCYGPVDIRCGACGAVRYCSRAHQRAHWTQHGRDCERLGEQMQRGVLFNEFPFTWSEEATWPADAGAISMCSFLEDRGLHGRGIWKAECGCSVNKVYEDAGGDKTEQLSDWHLSSSLCPCSDPSSMVFAPPRTWSEYYLWRGLGLESPVALILHWPLTLYYALSLVSEDLWVPSRLRNLRILYLGPEKELQELSVFGELLGLLVGAEIHIDLVGPAIPTARDGQIVKISGYSRCLDVDCICKQGAAPNASGGSLVFKLWTGMYHDRHVELWEGPRPHLILAPNAGVAAFSSWQQTIDLILESGVPAFFTDYCEEAGFLAEQCIRMVRDTALSFPVQINPFRQPFVTSNKGLEVPTYSNCIIFGIN